MVDLSSFTQGVKLMRLFVEEWLVVIPPNHLRKQFIETIMIMTYFHGSNVDLVWFWEKEDQKGEKKKTWKDYYIIF
jgi:hypothetical protein